MSKKTIPDKIKQQVAAVVEQFNQQNLKGSNRFYSTRYRGLYLYLDRTDYGVVSSICRLMFHGGMDDWDFAIFKYSSESYDPDEWFFPGSECVDGTVEGAMKAGLAAYS